MSGALSFLTQGTTPTASTNYSQTSTQLPSWYTDYTSQILNKAAQAANEPYQPYQGPRIASQSGLTNDAYSNASPLSAAATSGTQTAQNLVTQAANTNNPLGAAQPYLNSAATPTSQTVDQYMNPFNRNVTDQIAAAGNRNLTENVLPALQNSFTAAGNITGGSTTEADLAERAARDQGIATSNAQATALQNGYNGSLTAAGNDASRQAQVGQTAGTLASQGTQNAITAGGALSNINTQGTTNNINAINTQNTLGQQQQGYDQSHLNLAYQDFLNQKNQPLTAASEMQGALQGITVPTATTNYQYGNATGTTPTTSPINSITGALTGLGASTTPANNNYNPNNPFAV